MVAMSSGGWAGIGVIGLLILLLLAFWPARVASL